MFIHGYRIDHNHYLPYYIVSDLHKHYRALFHAIKQKSYRDRKHKYDVTIDYSRQSEACYITFEMPDRDITISIRNHDNFAGSMYDFALQLSDFDSWSQLKKFFIYRILPGILSNSSLEDEMENFYMAKRERNIKIYKDYRYSYA